MFSKPSLRPQHSGGAAETAFPDDFGVNTSENLDLRSVLRTIWIGKWLVLLCVLILAGLAAWAVSTATPLYEAEATVILQPEDQAVTGLENIVSGSSADLATINTELAILTSRSLLERVVNELNLSSDPEFNPRLREASAIDRAIGRLRALLPAPQPTGEAPDTNIEFRRLQRAVEALEDRLTVANLPDSYVFTVEVVTEAAPKSAEVANTLSRLYIRRQLESKFESQKEATNWLTERVAELKADLEAAEAAVESYSSESSFVSEEALLAQSRQLKDLRRRRADRLARREEVGQLMEAVEALRADGEFSEIASRLDEPRLTALAERIAEAANEEQRAERVVAFSTVLDRRLDQLAREADQMEAQSKVLGDSIEEAVQRLDANSVGFVELRQLQREAEASRLIYEYFLTRLKETSVQQGVQKADSYVLSPAIPPEFPSYPRLVRTVGLWGVFGLLLGVALVFLREHLQSTFRSPEELERSTGLRVLGVIPKAPSRAPLKYVAERPTSILAEALRNLRTSLRLSNAENPPKVIMVSSSVPSEGKSSTVLMLAQISAGLGRRVLVIECDNRRPTFAKHFGSQGALGLPSAVRGDVPFSEVIYDAGYGLDVVFAEDADDNAADIFSSNAFKSFLAAMREHYDLIFLDTPPVLAVPDARIIAEMSDTILYVVRWQSTTQQQVKAGLGLFRQLDLPVSGLVLTLTNARKMARYGYQGYGYGNAKSGKYYAN